MNLPTHLSANVLASLPLRYYCHWDWTSIAIFISLAILLDLDHLIYFIFKTKSLNPTSILKLGQNMRQTMTPGFYIFHSPEFNAVLLITAFFNHYLLIIAIASLIHITLDLFEHYRYHHNFRWSKKWSLIYNLKSII